MQNTRRINFVKDFTRSPGGRYRRSGPFSGEAFREDLLIPSLKDYDLVIVELDGAIGYPPSFLDEAFGVLVEKIGKAVVHDRLKFEITNDPITEARIQRILSKRS